MLPALPSLRDFAGNPTLLKPEHRVTTNAASTATGSAFYIPWQSCSLVQGLHCKSLWASCSCPAHSLLPRPMHNGPGVTKEPVDSGRQAPGPRERGGGALPTRHVEYPSSGIAS